jgi:putative transposase
MTHHLGCGPGDTKPDEATNHRNGTSGKTVLTDDGPLPIAVPRDRHSTFEPQLIGKHERRFTGFDDKIITDAVVAEVTAWQTRPPEALYPVVFFDALRVKIRDEGTVRSKAVYLALGVLADGTRDILGVWIEQTEGAQILDEDLHRAEGAWLRRNFDCGDRRPDGEPR